MIKVSFDFDNTLDRPKVQEYAKHLIDSWIDVHIVTSRKTNEVANNPNWNDDLFNVARQLGIPNNNIHFTNLEKKSDFFKGEYDFFMHLDDNWTELAQITSETNVAAVAVSGNKNWRAYAEIMMEGRYPKRHYLLWLDDYRNPFERNWIKTHIPEYADKMNDVIWVKDYNQFVEWINVNGLPHIIGFDHDLHDSHYAPEEIYQHDSNSKNGKHYDTWFKSQGDKIVEKTGLDAAKWLTEYCMDNNVALPKWFCQSANPAGVKNIDGLLISFYKNYNPTNNPLILTQAQKDRYTSELASDKWKNYTNGKRIWTPTPNIYD